MQEQTYPVNRKEQLMISRQGQILILTDVATGKKWYSQISWMRALIFGSRFFYYANKYIPLPSGTHRKIVRSSRNKDI